MWKATKDVLPEEGVPVETMIADEHGVRNEQRLFFERGLWFDPNSGMYMYYNPTHWKAV